MCTGGGQREGRETGGTYHSSREGVTESQGVIEDMLVTPMKELTHAAVRNALQNAATPYKKLLDFYNDAKAIVQQQAKAAKALAQ